MGNKNINEVTPSKMMVENVGYQITGRHELQHDDNEIAEALTTDFSYWLVARFKNIERQISNIYNSYLETWSFSSDYLNYIDRFITLGVINIEKLMEQNEGMDTSIKALNRMIDKIITGMRYLAFFYYYIKALQEVLSISSFDPLLEEMEAIMQEFKHTANHYNETIEQNNLPLYKIRIKKPMYKKDYEELLQYMSNLHTTTAPFYNLYAEYGKINIEIT